MTNEDERIAPTDYAGDDRYSETLVYDFAKFLTTLSILALGGVLTLVETADRADIKTGNIIIISVTIALAGTIAISTANAIASARASGQALPRHLHRYITATMALLGVGMGMFLFMWIDKLN